MLNQVFLVGRLASSIELQQNDNKEKVSNITLAVPRSMKNSDGQYDTDFIDCTLLGEVAINAKKYCNKGDVVGIKAYIKATTKLEDKIPLQLIANKVTFLSSKKENKE